MTRQVSGAALAVFLLAAAPALAQDRQTLGFGRLFSNDVLGDGEDRWRTGSYAFSVVRGERWTGGLPTRPGAIVEFRFRADIISPADLTIPTAPERLYAGTLSAGAHTYFSWRGFDVTAGADIAVIGEQTGLRALQSSFHDTFGFPPVEIGGYQVDDQVRGHATLEIGRQIDVGAAMVRPFMELQAGVETLARAGVDLSIGAPDALMLRDVGTGHRYIGVAGTDA
ncbi:MAG: lipid A-modifier LpxR family protein, partial [Pseudomonadota bacterium]